MNWKTGTFWIGAATLVGSVGAYSLTSTQVTTVAHYGDLAVTVLSIASAAAIALVAALRGKSGGVGG